MPMTCIRYPKQRSVRLFVFILVLSFNRNVSADVHHASPSPHPGPALTVDDIPTVVLVSLGGNETELFWPRGEACIKREIGLYDDVHLAVVTTTSDYEAEFRSELRTAAERHAAVASVLVYRTVDQGVRLLLHIGGHGSISGTIKEWDFAATPSQLEADEAALTAADAVRSVIAFDGSANPPPVRRRGAVALAISGAVTLGVGGVLHWRKIAHEHIANGIYSERQDTIHDGVNYKAEALEPKYFEEARKAKAFRVGAIVGYSIGGVLLTAGVLLFSLKSSDRESLVSLNRLTLKGTAIVWEF